MLGVAKMLTTGMNKITLPAACCLLCLAGHGVMLATGVEDNELQKLKLVACLGSGWMAAPWAPAAAT